MTDWQTQAIHASQASPVVSDLKPANPDTNDSATWDGVSGATALDRLRDLRRSIRAADDIRSESGSETSSDASGETRSETGSETHDEVHDETRSKASGESRDDSVERVGAGIDAGGSVNTGALDYQDRASEWIMQSPWKWVNLAWLLGGGYLLLIRIISWHIPASVLVTLSILYVVYGLGDTTTALPLIPALFSGAIMLGAFFIATDPVSSAASPAGKVIYGTGIGLLTFIIREFSSYPEGMAFAVLLMNICVPLIDHVVTGPGSRLRTPS
jgi:Na+-transporting NADH:ubiquinone oxidoreductase subunit NqrB